MECTIDRYTNQTASNPYLVREIVCDLDDATNEAVLLIHWAGGRHTEVRVPRVKTGRYPGDLAPTAVEVLRKLAGHWPDRELAVSLNRMLARRAMERRGQLSVSAKCANVLVSPNTIPPWRTVR